MIELRNWFTMTSAPIHGRSMEEFSSITPDSGRVFRLSAASLALMKHGVDIHVATLRRLEQLRSPCEHGKCA